MKINSQLTSKIYNFFNLKSHHIVCSGLLSLSFNIFFSDHLLQAFPLKAVSNPSISVDEQLFSSDKSALVKAIDHSLKYLQTDKAQEVYENYPMTEFSREKVIASLKRFRTLLLKSTTPQQLQKAVEREFVFYQSVGHDNQGTVSFTGYFQPVYKASRYPTAEYRYPLFRKPDDFDDWQTPHPTRRDLEGTDGLGTNSMIRGNELVWLNDRLKAYLIQVQGSAKLELTDGSTMTIGYNGATDYPYTSLGKELIKDGKIPPEEMSLPRLTQYLEEHPAELSIYLPRNKRFVFFEETGGRPAYGSLNVPVTDERSIATDKSIMPPGALALIRTKIPQLNSELELTTPVVSRYVVDQDTGSAIKGAGRVDIFFGTGNLAKTKAGLVDWTGELYYLLLK
jgi:membrane-bound lytic murein transglycosylase A